MKDVIWANKLKLDPNKTEVFLVKKNTNPGREVLSVLDVTILAQRVR